MSDIIPGQKQRCHTDSVVRSTLDDHASGAVVLRRLT